MAIWSMKASGNIRPMRFVKQLTTADETVAEADADELIFGVSQMGTRRPEYIDSNGYAASDGEDITVFGPHEVTLLEIAATVTAGQRLKSDADGKGTPVDTDLDPYGAVARESGASGDLIRVEVTPYMQYGV